MDDIVKVLYKSLISVVVMFIISKALGKKQVAQLEVIDYVIGISIGSIGAQMAFDTEIPEINFIIAMLIFGITDLMFTLVSRKANWLKKILKGKPLMIIEKGEINYKNLKRSKLDMNEVVAQCRKQGHFFINEIEYCIFETSGDFSVLSKFESQETTKEDLKLKAQPTQLQKQLVIDGKILFKELFALKKDEDWLLKKLKISTQKELKKFIYVTYDATSQKLYKYEK